MKSDQSAAETARDPQASAKSSGSTKPSTQAKSASTADSSSGGCAAQKLVNGKTEAEWTHICMNVCGASCCRHVAWGIYAPTTREDFDRMRYALLHPAVSFFKEDGSWYLHVTVPCTKLLPNNGCGIYLDRPQICRTYEAGACEWPDGLNWDEHFRTDTDLQEYLDRRWRRTTRAGAPLPEYLTVNVVVWPIDAPSSKSDFDEIRWAVLHRNIAVFKENGRWFLLVGSSCSVHGPAACINPTKRGWEEYIDSDAAIADYLGRRWPKRKSAPEPPTAAPPPPAGA